MSEMEFDSAPQEDVTFDKFEESAIQSHNVKFLAESYRLAYDEEEMYRHAHEKAKLKKEKLAEALYDVLIAEGISQVRIPEVGTISPVSEESCSILPGMEERAFDLLDEAGWGAAIKRTIPWQTLNKIYREEQIDAYIDPEVFKTWTRKKVRMLRAKGTV